MVSTNNLSKLQIGLIVTHGNYSENKKYKNLICNNYFSKA